MTLAQINSPAGRSTLEHPHDITVVSGCQEFVGKRQKRGGAARSLEAAVHERSVTAARAGSAAVRLAAEPLHNTGQLFRERREQSLLR
jgi:hypothetical protein